ncbi:ferritin-like domain-containing protein [Rufibacter radiotolerans]|uniref:ferritin-like domain-containing protein n=1 Tax=Rufibacter radiotolerans TaxID=1379910 RepID=UPI00066475BB|nr:PA2169 family four-helix-bundle protein [Rufibacter radiotolerans]
MSANENKKVVEVLKELNEFVHDGLEGYERAAQESKDQLRQDIYRKFSQQRLAFANELNMIIQRHGGSPERDTTTKGKLYRQWMDFKAALTGRDEEAILGSSIYGEEWAQKAYRDALDQELPAEVRGVLLRQREASTDVLQRLHQLREGSTDATKAPSGRGRATTGATSSAGTSTGGNVTLKTALIAAGAAAGAALVYGLLSKRIPTDKLMSTISNITKDKSGDNGQMATRTKKNKDKTKKKNKTKTQ